MTFKEKFQQLQASGLDQDVIDNAFGQFVWNKAQTVRVIAEDDEGNVIDVDCPLMRVDFGDLGYNARLENDGMLYD